MPTIEKIEKYKGKTYRIDFTEGEPAFINHEIVSDFALRSGISLTDEQWAEVVAANDFRRARERALYLLDYRDYSYIEMYKKLHENYDEQLCFDVCDKLAEWGLINDRRYAKTLAAKYVITKGYGYYRAQREMRQKGLSKALVDETLAEYEDGTAERLAQLIEKKFMRKLEADGGEKKVKDALARLGYSYSDIKAAMEMVCAEDE